MPPTAPAPRAARPLLRSALVPLTIALVGAVTASCTNAKLDESSSAAATTTTAATEFGEGTDAATIDPGGGRTGPITSGSSPLKGMKGAAPGIRITEDFRDRVRAVDGTVDDFTGAAEGYDIVMVLAISAESARSDSPGRIADEVISSTEGGRTCLGYHACREFALDNTDFDYDGVSGNIDLLANGDPGEAGFAVVEFTGTGALRAVDQVTVQSRPLADRPAGADPIYGPIGNGVLEIGTLLPVMGPDGAAARAALAGAKVAVDEVNAEGGVLGEPVVLVPDESGDGSSSATTDAVRRLIDRPVDAVIGGTVYGITSVAIPELTDAGIILFSPTDTARALSVADDRGLFFRLSPPTDLEGQVLGNLITNDGYTRVAIAAGTGDDNQELAADIAAAINADSGTVTATVEVGDNPDGAAIAQQLIDSDPQALVIVTSAPAAALIVRGLVAKGKGPSTIATYGTAADMTDELAQLVGG